MGVFTAVTRIRSIRPVLGVALGRQGVLPERDDSNLDRTHRPATITDATLSGRARLRAGPHQLVAGDKQIRTAANRRVRPLPGTESTSVVGALSAIKCRPIWTGGNQSCTAEPPVENIRSITKSDTSEPPYVNSPAVLAFDDETRRRNTLAAGEVAG
jgi:hypothetical protein